MGWPPLVKGLVTRHEITNYEILSRHRMNDNGTYLLTGLNINYQTVYKIGLRFRADWGWLSSEVGN